MAAYCTTYLDDSIVVTGSSEEAWRAARILGYVWQYLGLQDSSQNRRMSRQDGGPWRGAKLHIVHGSIYRIIGEVKWAKTCLKTKKMVENFCIGRTLLLQGVEN